METSLKIEKADHQKTKSNFENKLNEEKSKCDSNSNQSQIKLNSVQQHFKLLEVGSRLIYNFIITITIEDRIRGLQRRMC